MSRNVPAFMTYEITVQPGDDHIDFSAGDFISCLESSHKYFKLAIDDLPFSKFAAGLHFKVEGGFTGFRVRNDSVIPLTVTIAVGIGKFEDRRFVQADAQGINQQLVASIKAKSFTGKTIANPGAGLYSHVQLWNPAGSNKNVVITAMLAGLYMTAASLDFRTHDAALADFQDNPVSCYLGGGIGASELRRESTAGIIPPLGSWKTVTPPINASIEVPMGGPIILPPGIGLVVLANVVNTSFYMSFDIIEEAV